MALIKFEQDKVLNGLIICPYWPSKPWYSKLLEMLIDSPLVFPDSCITDPSHMLPRHCHFLAWPIGSELSQRLAYQERLPNVSSKVLSKIPWLDTKDIGKSSVVGVLQRKCVIARSV